jgi:hypothetical protein
MIRPVMDGCAFRAYITGLKADVLRAPDKLPQIIAYVTMPGLPGPVKPSLVLHFH